VAISHGCRGVAARACGLVNLEPTKVLYTSAIFLVNFDRNLVSKKKKLCLAHLLFVSKRIMWKPSSSAI
jgi:hypothetical protein